MGPSPGLVPKRIGYVIKADYSVNVLSNLGCGVNDSFQRVYDEADGSHF